MSLASACGVRSAPGSKPGGAPVRIPRVAANPPPDTHTHSPSYQEWVPDFKVGEK